jgi:hypothetical protein
MIGTGTAAGITTETAIGTMIGIADMTGIAITSAFGGLSFGGGRFAWGAD